MYKKIVILLLITVLTIPFVVSAKTTLVSSESELIEALKDKDADTIKLSKDIDTTQKINITRPVTIDGNNHTIKYVGTFGTDNSKSNTVWGGIYVLHFYKTTGTVKNIKLTGGNAALLINGSKVTLDGNIDVSGNSFGGIELGKGKDVNDAPSVALTDDINIINNTENNNAPTMWVAKDGADGTITMNGITKKLEEGQEFSIDEIEKVIGLDITENPNTGDNILVYTSSLFVSIFGIIYTIKFINKKETY